MPRKLTVRLHQGSNTENTHTGYKSGGVRTGWGGYRDLNCLGQVVTIASHPWFVSVPNLVHQGDLARCSFRPIPAPRPLPGTEGPSSPWGQSDLSLAVFPLLLNAVTSGHRGLGSGSQGGEGVICPPTTPQLLGPCGRETALPGGASTRGTTACWVHPCFLGGLGFPSSPSLP